MRDGDTHHGVLGERPARPRALLLDFYGTIVEEDDARIAAICDEIAVASAQGPTSQEVAAHWSERFAALCCESNGPRFQSQKALELLSLQDTLARYAAELDAEKLSQRLYEYWRRPPVFSEAREVLARCPIPTCLVSNIDNAELEVALAYTGFCFDAVVTSEDCRAYKPHPEPFLRALELLGLAPQETLHVGDSLQSDVRGAKGLNIPVLWVNRRGRKLPAEHDQPEFVSSDLRALLSVI